jgi:hypothetical protein
MTSLRTVLLGGGVACSVALAGCGGSLDGHSAKENALAQALAPYTVRPGEETGYSTSGLPALVTTAAAWAKGDTDAAAVTKRLESDGFRAVLRQSTVSTGNAPGLSLVIELGSPAEARSEERAGLATALATEHANKVNRFKVTGIPGAQGFVSQAPGEFDANLLFTEGSCALVVGALNGESTRSVAQAVIEGSRKIYARTINSHGICTKG